MENRRAPIDDTALLKLLKAGSGQSEAARTLDYPVGTVASRVKKLRERGIYLDDGTVDWHALHTWESGHKRKRPTQSQSATHAKGKHDPQLTESDPQMATVQPTARPTIEGPRSRRHVLLNVQLWDQAEQRAKAEGKTPGRIIDMALAAYLGAGIEEGA